MELRLDGRTALITGAASGIGRAVAEAMAEAGANVVINHLRRSSDAAEVARRAAGMGVRSLAVEADVSDAAAVRRMFTIARDGIGPIDILVNNAGISRPMPFLELTEEDWDRILDTNLKSVFLCSQAALPAMLERGDGVIINMASELAYLGRAEFSPYTASKGGMLSLTRSLAREFAPTVRVNAVAPGPVDTELLRAELATADAAAADEEIPAGRFGTPEEVAASVVFLASDQARFYYGEVLSPNGGALMR